MSKTKRRIQRKRNGNGSVPMEVLTVSERDVEALRAAEVLVTRLKLALADIDMQLMAAQRQRDAVRAELEQAQGQLTQAGKDAVLHAGGDLDQRWNIDLTKMQIARA